MNANPKTIDSENYYDHDQSDLLKLVRVPVDSVLEIGCATGNMLRHYVDAGATRVTGVEFVSTVGEIARQRCPEALIFINDVDQVPLEELGSDYDLLIASFVLEHVTDPWHTLGRLASIMRQGGQLVGSLPNVRHCSVTVPLLLKGKWEYKDKGIMDRTHYRFFSKSTIEELLTATGFTEIDIQPWVLPGKSAIANNATLGLAIDHFAFAYRFSAIRG
jgi:2-polyprenyl-3-methyl-5-hydroxy-6-metoxy-1,4-benzoquinol methylase